MWFVGWNEVVAIRTRREVLMNHNPCGLSTEPAAEAIRR
jgi:hypothetical protein